LTVSNKRSLADTIITNIYVAFLIIAWNRGNRFAVVYLPFWNKSFLLKCRSASCCRMPYPPLCGLYNQLRNRWNVFAELIVSSLNFFCRLFFKKLNGLLKLPNNPVVFGKLRILSMVARLFFKSFTSNLLAFLNTPPKVRYWCLLSGIRRWFI